MGSEFSYHDCRRSRGGRRSGRLTPALHPSGFVLEGVEGRGVCVSAVRARAHVVAEHTEVADTAHANEVHAVRHVVVLAPRAPRQLLAALPAQLGVLDHSRGREDLNSAIHHGEVRRVRELVAVHDIDLLPDVRPHVVPDPPGHEDGIWVDLDGPVIILEASAGYHLVPHRHEEFRVARGAVLGDAHADLGDQDGLHLDAVFRDAHRRGIRREDVVAVALEDAGVGLEVRLQQRVLVGAGHEEGEAEERGVALDRETPTPRALRIAAPSLVAIVRVWLRAARLLARPPILALHIALRVHGVAALRVEAIRALSRAVLNDPRLDLPDNPGGGALGPVGRARADGRAIPRLLPRVPLLALGAIRAALGVVLALPVALVARVRAETLGRAVLARVRARLDDPRRRAHGRRAEGLAAPRLEVLLEEVRARGALRFAGRPVLVLLEALRAAFDAALRVAAVLADGGALLGRAGGAVAQRLADPRLGRGLVQDVRAGHTLRHALRPPSVLRKALGSRVLAALGLETTGAGICTALVGLLVRTRDGPVAVEPDTGVVVVRPFGRRDVPQRHDLHRRLRHGRRRGWCSQGQHRDRGHRPGVVGRPILDFLRLHAAARQNGRRGRHCAAGGTGAGSMQLRGQRADGGQGAQGEGRRGGEAPASRLGGCIEMGQQEGVRG
mmetsp:Transcript_139881/g.446352  ORF Transcript_139881/g.446352 Transcript_139881/m.446352 type:complete len:670 (+) Transcript_139881:325-2334(+)